MASIDDKIALLEELKNSLMLRVDNILTEHKDDMLEMQKEQLFEGKDSEGNDLRPYYTEDLKSKGGFFSSPDAAERYAKWKEGLSYPSNSAGRRNPNAPNLYISGKLFHDNLDLIISDTLVEFVSKNITGAGIMEKYGSEKFGLNEENWNKIREEWIKESIINFLRKGFE